MGIQEFDPKYRIKLDAVSQCKLRNVLEYTLRDSTINITSFYNETVSFEKKNEISGYPSYESLTLAIIIYYHIPKFFNLGKMLIDLTDHNKLIDLYYDEYEKRTSWEEKSIEIPAIHKTYEHDTIL